MQVGHVKGDVSFGVNHEAVFFAILARRDHKGATLVAYLKLAVPTRQVEHGALPLGGVQDEPPVTKRRG